MKQNNNGVYYGIATFVEPKIAHDLIEEHPAYFLDEFIYITSAYLQPRRNNGKKGKSPPKSRDGFKPKQERSSHNDRSSAWTGGDRFYRHPKAQTQPQSQSQPQTQPQTNFRPNPIHIPKKMSPISPPISPTGNGPISNQISRPKSISPTGVLIQQIPKPVFEADVAHLAAKLKHVGMPNSHPFFDRSPQANQMPTNQIHSRPIKDDILAMDSLFDSGNSSPDDSYMLCAHNSFQMTFNGSNQGQLHRRETTGNGLYPFGLCLPDYSRGFKTISRCSSFSESKDELLSGYLENSVNPLSTKLY